MSIMFFAPKIHALTHISASETSPPFATYVANARDSVARRSLLERKSEGLKRRSTCGKSTSLLPIEVCDVFPVRDGGIFSLNIFSRVITLSLAKLVRNVLEEYWPSVFFVRSSLRLVRTVNTWGRHSPSTALG